MALDKRSVIDRKEFNELLGVSPMNPANVAITGGTAQVNDGTVTAPSLAFTTQPNTGLYRGFTSEIWFATNGVNKFTVNPTLCKLAASQGIGWTGNADTAGNTDTTLYRDAANVLGQRNGATAQTSRVYNTFTDVNNGEWGGLDWQTTANTLRLRSQANGSGTVRPIAIDAFAKAGAAVAGDIPSGTFALVRDTVGGTTKLIYNNAGTLMSVALT